MRSLAVAACLLAIPFLSSAQTEKSSWANLNALRPGQKIQLVGTDSKSHTGTFLSVSPAAISLEEKDGEHTIQMQDVSIVKLPRHRRRLRNALIGGAVGLGAGAGIGAAAYRKCTPPHGDNLFGCLDLGRSFNAAFGAAIGLVGGTVVGVVLPTSKIIYRVAVDGRAPKP